MGLIANYKWKMICRSDFEKAAARANVDISNNYYEFKHDILNELESSNVINSHLETARAHLLYHLIRYGKMNDKLVNIVDKEYWRAYSRFVLKTKRFSDVVTITFSIICLLLCIGWAIFYIIKIPAFIWKLIGLYLVILFVVYLVSYVYRIIKKRLQ